LTEQETLAPLSSSSTKHALCVTSFSLQRPRRARDSILPFNLTRSRSLTQTLAFLPLPPQPDPLHSPLTFVIFLSACSRMPLPPPHHRAAVSVAPTSGQEYQELRTIFLAVPVERSMPRRSEMEKFEPSSPLLAATRRRNSPPSVLLLLVRPLTRSLR
jgi:hypothetical protein